MMDVEPFKITPYRLFIGYYILSVEDIIDQVKKWKNARESLFFYLIKLLSLSSLYYYYYHYYIIIIVIIIIIIIIIIIYLFIIFYNIIFFLNSQNDYMKITMKS